MPVTLTKVHKHISKKRGKVEALHEFSRDARRLRRAGARDDRVASSNTTTMKARQPYMDRIDYFHDAVASLEEPLSDSEMAELVQQCINRDVEEIEQLKKEQRKGRPPTRRQEALTQRTQTEEKEFKTGFWMPDLTDASVLVALKKWNAQWSGLSQMKFMRLLQSGEKKASSFPPNGMS
ncbi:hypothetical protein N7495_009760 [Penicillium taxi]|uniref:uncharacterized protein n=1 Tax=Penicillium taxi TaxID=168475 RepID=UPI0025459678|nr:uncharacterized protein N7495_009760 [Penicillium taxi]KAJ5885250.1 hypothetical protein N7495_009760 [Penicillium taxi]